MDQNQDIMGLWEIFFFFLIITRTWKIFEKTEPDGVQLDRECFIFPGEKEGEDKR